MELRNPDIDPDTTSAVTSRPSLERVPPARPDRAPWIGLGIAVLLVGAAIAVPPLAHWQVDASLHPVRPFAPLAGYVEGRVGPGTPVAVVVAVLAVWRGFELAGRLGWHGLLVTTYAAALAWTLSLAYVDGRAGLTREIVNHNEYLPTARRNHDVAALLRGFVDRIPADAPGSWETHVAGHPPGALLLFVGLVSVGLGGALASALAVTIVGCTTPVAVLVTLRRLGAEDVARRVAPFLVLAPAAIWVAVSADAVFAAVAAWGLAVLAAATTSRGPARVWGRGLLGGLLLGSCLLLSYGLLLLAPLVLAVLLAGRSWRALPAVAVGAVIPILLFALLGFRLWEAYPVLSDRYWAGIAAGRPAAYWFWGDLAALAIAAGPALAAGLGSLIAAGKRSPRVVRLLVGAAAVAIVVADASRMSKAEVERIWLPFVPWLLLSTACLPSRWQRPMLGAQVVVALLVQHLVVTNW
jgi:methylthioxylose transferase